MVGKLSDEELGRLSETMGESMPLFFLEMNRSQELFIRIKNKIGNTPKRRLFEAGNKNGKCLVYSALIDTLNGEVSIGSLFEKGKSFDVFAWDGKKKVVAKATAPFKKDGFHKCYRVTMSDGRMVEGADLHRILCEDGRYVPIEDLHESYSQNLLGSSQGSYPLTRGGDDRHFAGTRSDSLGHYFGDSRQCGERLQTVQDTFQGLIPSQADVQPSFDSELREDELEHKYTNIHRLAFSPPSIKEIYPRHVGRFYKFLTRNAYKFYQLLLHGLQSVPQLSTAEGIQLQLSNEFFECPLPLGNAVSSFSHPLTFGNKIINTKLVKSQEVYDFHVEKYHNYFAGGLVHHNTRIGIAEDLAHSFGYRPWLMEGDIDFRVGIKVPNTGLVAGETVIHSIGEKIEPELRYLIPPQCKPVYKPGATGHLLKLTLQYCPFGEGCGSTIYLRSYDQKPSTFEGIDYDWVHFDEPPPEAILKAVERGKVSTNARSWYTMTPIKEAYIYNLFSERAATVV